MANTTEATEFDDELLEEIFDIMDRDKNGHICRVEFVNLLCGLGMNPTKEQEDIIFKEIDTDGSGVMDRAEVKAWLNKNKNKYNNDSESIGKAFHIFDKNNNGFIELDELIHLVKALAIDITPENVKEMVADMDSNNDKRINYDEFAKYLTKPMIKRKK